MKYLPNSAAVLLGSLACVYSGYWAHSRVWSPKATGAELTRLATENGGLRAEIGWLEEDRKNREGAIELIHTSDMKDLKICERRLAREAEVLVGVKQALEGSPTAAGQVQTIKELLENQP